MSRALLVQEMSALEFQEWKAFFQIEREEVAPMRREAVGGTALDAQIRASLDSFRA